MTWYKVEIDSGYELDGETRIWYQALDHGKPCRFDTHDEAKIFLEGSGLASLAPCRIVKVTEEVVG
jgi:hypothetical protein